MTSSNPISKYSSAKTDAFISGIVDNVQLGKDNYLVPLFEVVVNAIQSIKLRNTADGEISIYVNRVEPSQLKVDGDLDLITDITGFRVVDNGLGFNDENFKAFNTLYTPIKKVKFGCKGVGRYVAIKAFNKIEISSNYQQGDSFYKREFSFSVENGIQANKVPEKVQNQLFKTEVQLVDYRTRYRQRPKPETLAHRILEHCMVDFILSDPPQIRIFDPASVDVINLVDLFQEKIQVEDTVDLFSLNGHEFEMNYIKQFVGDRIHRLHYVADGREVDSLELKKLLPNLKSKLTNPEDQKKYSISAYLKSAYLNSKSNLERGEFKIPKKISDKGFLDKDEISMEEINESVKTKLKEYLADELEEISTSVVEEMKQFILDNTLVEYRHLIPVLKDNVELLPHKGSFEEKDIALHKLNYKLESDHKIEVNRFLSQDPTITNADDYKSIFNSIDSILETEKGFLSSKLANYMLHRKTVLKLFEKYLQIQSDGKYRYEKEIHNIIFRKKRTTDDLAFDDHNLWILDERLAFHEFIASDVGFDRNRKVSIDSATAVDLTVYDSVFLYGEGDSSLVFFEFKRPGRKEYKRDEKDLGKQITDAVLELLEGDPRDHNGEAIEINVSTPKFGYVIADLNKNLRERLGYLYKKTPKGTYFKFDDGLGLFIEIMSYKQLLKDADLRHKAFFSKMNLDKI